jgi:geranylgeranylglycerol-phosphate geranylgeranyltransferase
VQRNSNKAYLGIIRPVNSIIVGIAVISGVILTSTNYVLSLGTLFGFLTGFLISGFSMIVNDIYDVEVDKINQLDRPLVTGEIKKTAAWVYAFSMLFLGLFFSTLSGLECFVIAATFAFISWLYNYNLKKHGIIGNATVALSTAIPYIYGSIISLTGNMEMRGWAILKGISPLVIWFSAISFLAVTGREVIKTIVDVKGDRIRNVKSVARTIGELNAARIGAFLFALSVICTIGPYVLKQAGNIYFIMVLLPDAIFIYLSYLILKDCSVRNALKVKKLALAGMFLGLLAFVAEKILVT